MKNFLAHVTRRIDVEHEERITSTPGATLAGAVPRRGERGNQSPELRREVIRAKQREYSATMAAAKAAAQAGESGRLAVLVAALPPSLRSELFGWCQRNGLGWPS